MYDPGTTTFAIAKKLQKAEIFVFVMVGLPYQGKSCEREMPARLDVLLLISQVS